jgi:hypothetical protein
MEALALVAIGYVGTAFWPLSPEGFAVIYVTQQGWNPLVVGLLAASGQAGAHATLYFGGDQLRRRWPWFDRTCERARTRHGRRLERGQVPLALVSGLVGIPPSSVTAALAPGLGISARVLLPLMFVMRIIRISVVAALVGAGVHIFGH